MSKQEIITLSIKGKNLDSIPIDQFIPMLNAFDKMSQMAFLVHQGEEKLSAPVLPEDFQVRFKSATPGSIDITFVYLVVESYNQVKYVVGENPWTVPQWLKHKNVAFYAAAFVMAALNVRGCDINVHIGDNNVQNNFVLPKEINKRMESPVKQFVKPFADNEDIESFLLSSGTYKMLINRENLHPLLSNMERLPVAAAGLRREISGNEMSVKILHFHSGEMEGELIVVGDKNKTPVRFHASRQLHGKIIGALDGAVEHADIIAQSEENNAGDILVIKGIELVNHPLRTRNNDTGRTR